MQTLTGFIDSHIPTKGRQATRRNYTRRKHDTRPWLFIDGEGVTVDGEHRYVQFAGMSSTDLVGHSIADPNGLTTEAIFEHIFALRDAYPNHITVIYGGSYDFNMWLFGLPLSLPNLTRVYNGDPTRYGKYTIKWMRGKNFHVGRYGVKGSGVTIYDVVSFFQQSFVKACDAYLGEEWIDRDNIIASKARRGDFTLSELDAITAYNDSELINGCALMDELRDRLSAVELFPRRWDGPGAIAAYLLQREGVKDHMAVSPDPVQEAARYAYAGGRFEVLKFGHCIEPCWEYDVNSAYPAALQHVPSLAGGTWEHSIGDPGKQAFAIYHIQWNVKRMDIPGPFFRRNDNGTVNYPCQGTGWYWSPEYDSGKLYMETVEGTMTILDAWIFHPATDIKPFGFIPELYHERMLLKAAKNGAHVGIKLALNSLYGKLAQQVGARFENGEWKLPPFHQLEWAGYTTSYCRAAVLTAALSDIESVIAFETDALFTTRQLPVATGEGLGLFEFKAFDNLTYFQSGIYFATDSSGKEIDITAKTRGVDRGQLGRDECLNAFHNAADSAGTVPTTLRRFNGLGIALMLGMARWCKWEELPKKIKLEPMTKRAHACTDDACHEAKQARNPHWHETACFDLRDRHSTAFPVAWANPSHDMNRLDELRRMVPDWETGVVDETEPGE